MTCPKNTKVGSPLNWEHPNPERQKKIAELRENQRQRAIINLRRSGTPVQYTSDHILLLVISDKVEVRDNGEGLSVKIEGHDITDQVQFIQTRQAPGRDPEIIVTFKPQPFQAYTDEKGRIRERK